MRVLEILGIGHHAYIAIPHCLVVVVVVISERLGLATIQSHHKDASIGDPRESRCIVLVVQIENLIF